MDAEEVLKEHVPEIRKKCEAKSLMLEIGYIFTTATKQEIERTLDREGNLITMEMILYKLPQRDNWVEAFHKALNGKELNLPRLAKLFEPFLNEESDTEMRYDSGIGPSLEQRYTLETRLEDFLHLQRKWMPYIDKYGLDPGAKLGDLMDKLYLKDKNAYNQLKNESRITHSYIRQATTHEETASIDTASGFSPSESNAGFSHPTTTQSLPVMPDTNNSAPSSHSLDFQQTGFAPLREAIYYQEKAFEKSTQNQKDDIASLPEAVYRKEKALEKTTPNEAHDIASLPEAVYRKEKAFEKTTPNEARDIASLPEAVYRKEKALEKTTPNEARDIASLPEAVYRKEKALEKTAPNEAHTRVSPLQDKHSTTSLPTIQTRVHEKEILAVDESTKGVPELDVGKVEVQERDVGKVEVQERDVGKVGVLEKDVGKVGVLEKDVGKVGVLEKDVGKVGVQEKDVGKVGVQEKDVGKVGVQEKDVGKGRVLDVGNCKVVVRESDEGSVEIMQVDGDSVEVLQVDGDSVEVPQVDGGSVEVPQVDGGSVEVPQVDGGSVEVPQVEEAPEYDNNASSPTEKNQPFFSKQYMGILVSGIVLSISLVYFLRKR